MISSALADAMRIYGATTVSRTPTHVVRDEPPVKTVDLTQTPQQKQTSVLIEDRTTQYQYSLQDLKNKEMRSYFLKYLGIEEREIKDINFESFLQVWQGYEDALADRLQDQRIVYKNDRINPERPWKDAGYKAKGIFDSTELRQLNALIEKVKNNHELASKIRSFGETPSRESRKITFIPGYTNKTA